MWGLEIFGGEVADALGCKVFVLRIILPGKNKGLRLIEKRRSMVAALESEKDRVQRFK